jgi:hypothetical protein
MKEKVAETTQTEDPMEISSDPVPEAFMDVDVPQPLPLRTPGPSPSPPSPPRSPRIEEVPDEGDPYIPLGRATGYERYVQEPDEMEQSHAGRPFGRNATVFDNLCAEQEETGQSRYGVFTNEEIAEVAEFLVECVGKGDADRFLKLKRVRAPSAPCSASLKLMCDSFVLAPTYRG